MTRLRFIEFPLFLEGMTLQSEAATSRSIAILCGISRCPVGKIKRERFSGKPERTQ